ncbi:MAG TPA: type II 3-dehydroquinate dehydratase [Candidatus Solibacter sp.]|nr:type II 3-dehydroquinate dehydratase [Candidatus Solibacter sp.]
MVVINGPNLNRLGTRQPEIYGTTTLSQVEQMLVARGAELGWAVETYQSNHEGDLIDRVQAAAEHGVDGLILNPGALTHYSYALLDALQSVDLPAVEVHISDIDNREEWRRKSVTSEACVGVIKGKGVHGYIEALELLDGRVSTEVST